MRKKCTLGLLDKHQWLTIWDYMTRVNRYWDYMTDTKSYQFRITQKTQGGCY